MTPRVLEARVAPAAVDRLEPRVLFAADLVVSEFMASNSATLADSDGDYSDWVEIHNRGDAAASLGGMYLTDSASTLGKWRFPAGQALNPGGRLVVFASEKDRAVAGQQLHTNFKLDAGGEFLSLVAADGVTPVFSYSPSYPTQSSDVSYGLTNESTTTGRLTYFAQPTPGTPNQQDAGEPMFSHPSRTFSGPLSLTLSTPTPGGVIRYTLDGSIPNAGSTIYTGPISFERSRVVRAQVFAAGMAPGPVVSRTFAYVDAGTAGFNSNLPLVVVDTYGAGLNESSLTPASAFFIDTSKADGRAEILDPVDFAGRGGIRYRGQSSQGFPKAPYAFETWDESNGDLEVSILGMPKESDWILYNPFSEKSLMQNHLAYLWANRMGQYAVRTRFVELFVNNGPGAGGGGELNRRIDQASDYVGVYIFMEKIKIDDDRVDIAKLSPSDNALPNVTGGYIFKKDKFDGNENGFTTSIGQQLLNVEPAENEITPQQQSYLLGYINQFEAALYGHNFRDPVNGYQKYIDVDSWIDHHLMVELTKNIDGFRISTYFSKDRGGKIRMVPIWDYNLSMGNADYYAGNQPAGWYYDQLGDSEYPYFRRLFQDPDFAQRWVDRWQELRADLFSNDRLLGDVDDAVDLLSDGNGNFPVGQYPTKAPNNPVVRNFRRWNILGTYVWPNGYYSDSWIQDVEWMRNDFLAARLDWIDGLYLAPPTLSRPGGRQTAPFQLTMSGPVGPLIYYTLDGSDPRDVAGARNPRAVQYSGPVTVSATTRVRARRWDGQRWSGEADAVYAFGDNPLRVSEVMYNPAPVPAGSPYLADDFEFLEVHNTGPAAVNLTGTRFAAGVDFTFGNRTLAAGARTVVVRNVDAFRSRYGNVDVSGTYVGALDDGGERILLQGPAGEPIVEFSYEDDWYPQTDGAGYSLVVATNSTDAAVLSGAGSWRPGNPLHGAPGLVDVSIAPRSVVINEVLSNTSGGAGDWIELRNTTAAPIDVGGWFVSNSPADLRKYRIAAGTVIPANGYLTFWESSHFGTQNLPGVSVPFELNAAGDSVYLSSVDAAGNVGGYRESEDFDAADAEVAFARYVKPSGGADVVAALSPTPGAANAMPRVGPVVISELMYHPATGKPEFIELRNTSAAAIALTGWRFTGGIDYALPAGASVPANGFALVVPIDPAAFRSQHNVPAAVPIYGPYTLPDGSGEALDNAGDNVALSRPGAAAAAPGFVLVDRVKYDDDAPWPLTPGGTGPSLGRRNAFAYGNDPANWAADLVNGTPGRPNSVAGGVAVTGRRVFYNNSSFDNNGAAVTDADALAIATDKSALRPGQTATFNNYTSYSRGLNGIIIDFAGMPPGLNLTAGDFLFKTGNDNNPLGWVPVPAPAAVTALAGPVGANAARFAISWADGAIRNTWLQVTVLGTERTGLAAPDVFYFGNAVGESGNSPQNAQVTTADELAARGHPRGASNPAPVTWNWDYNRDRRVDSKDWMIARQNTTTAATTLRLITVPVGLQAAARPPAPRPLTAFIATPRTANPSIEEHDGLPH